MGYAILASEIFGILVLMVILYGSYFESKARSQTKKAFAVLVLSVLISLFFDALTYAPINWANLPFLHFAVTLIDFLGPFFMFALFMQYIYLHFISKAQISRFLFGCAEVFCILGIIAATVFGFQGKLFLLENGVYYPGPYYQGYLLTYVVVLGLSILAILRNTKLIGLHDVLAAMLFLAIPIVAIIINLVNEEMAFSVASMALSMLVVDKMLQSRRESDLIADAETSEKLAYSDQLTGLKNRLAYSKTVFSMTSGNGVVGVVFADLNGLKYTNDHYGHKAGDELLCDFSKMLLKSFRKNDVYRISGDEFVVLATGMTKEHFYGRVKTLTNDANKYKFQIAAIGTDFGSQSEVSRLVDRAEQNMYVVKKAFHKKYPDLGRKSDIFFDDDDEGEGESEGGESETNGTQD